MDATVISRFQDVRDPARPIYEVGDAFQGDAERVRGLAERGYVEPRAARGRRSAKAKGK